MRNLLFVLLIILSGCSAQKAQYSDFYKSTIESQSADSKIEISTGEVEYFIDSNGFLYIRGPYKEDKEHWLTFTVWVLRYDFDMPRACFGQLKPEYAHLFSDLASTLNDKQLYDTPDKDTEETFIDHEISYVLHAETPAGHIHTDAIQLSLSKSTKASIIKSTVDYFHNLGLNPFKWQPKKSAFVEFKCT